MTPQHQYEYTFAYVTEYVGRGREWNCFVSALGSD